MISVSHSHNLKMSQQIRVRKPTRVETLREEVTFIVRDLFNYRSERSPSFTKPIINDGELEFYHDYVLASALIMYDLVNYKQKTEYEAMNTIRELARQYPYRSSRGPKRPVVQKDETVKYGKLIPGDDIRDACHASAVLACYNHLTDYLEQNPLLKPTTAIAIVQD